MAFSVSSSGSCPLFISLVWFFLQFYSFLSLICNCSYVTGLRHRNRKKWIYLPSAPRKWVFLKLASPSFWRPSVDNLGLDFGWGAMAAHCGTPQQTSSHQNWGLLVSSLGGFVVLLHQGSNQWLISTKQ